MMRGYLCELWAKHSTVNCPSPEGFLYAQVESCEVISQAEEILRSHKIESLGGLQ